MLLSNKIIIEINKGNIGFYKKNNPDIKVGDFIEIETKELSAGSNQIVDVRCYNCGIILKIPYARYYKKIKKSNRYPCKSCSVYDLKKTNLEKYGVDNPFKSEEIKKKIKNTNLEKYGVDSYTKSEDYNDKLKNTCIEKYGVEHHTMSDLVKDKIKSTNMERYGGHFSKTEEFKSKVKNTNMKNYGCEYVTNLDFFKEKVKKTNLIRWGVENVFQSETIRSKILKSNIEKIECEYHTKSDVWRNNNYKISNSEFYIKYLGSEISLFKCDNNSDHNFKIKSDNYYSRLNLNNKLCTICFPIGDLKSIKEKEVYEIIKSIYFYEIIESYRDGLEIDIFIPELKLGFEFNGLYYHSDKFKDKNYHIDKTNHFKERGIRIIHIWEDDWVYKKEIIKSQILNIIGLSNKIGARKCDVMEIKDLKLVREFLNNNHKIGRAHV